jgi:hypothetical protein
VTQFIRSILRAGWAKAFIKVRPDIRAAAPASLAGESGLQIRQPNLIRPTASVDLDPVYALVVGAVNEKAANPHRAYFAEMIV